MRDKHSPAMRRYTLRYTLHAVSWRQINILSEGMGAKTYTACAYADPIPNMHAALHETTRDSPRRVRRMTMLGVNWRQGGKIAWMGGPQWPNWATTKLHVDFLSHADSACCRWPVLWVMDLVSIASAGSRPQWLPGTEMSWNGESPFFCTNQSDG
jgi:hypothetical protein